MTTLFLPAGHWTSGQKRRLFLLLGREGQGLQQNQFQPISPIYFKMKFLNKKKTVKGFSLVEMIIYACVLSVLTIVTINAVFSSVRSFAEFRVDRDLNSSATSLMERITREIRSAYAIDAGQSSFDINPGRLTILNKNAGGTDTAVEFYVENSLLKTKENGVATGSLISSSTAITNFTVRSLLNSNSNAIKVEIGLTATRAGISKSGNYYSTILLRGSY